MNDCIKQMNVYKDGYEWVEGETTFERFIVDTNIKVFLCIINEFRYITINHKYVRTIIIHTTKFVVRKKHQFYFY